MSGNGYPRIDGTDNGIWRRMAVVHWPVTIEEKRQREFDDMLTIFVPEYPGILNWLIDGALRFIESGLPNPPAVSEATREYRDEMGPVGQFVQIMSSPLRGTMRPRATAMRPICPGALNAK
jgi:putative DNA primase/helicase